MLAALQKNLLSSQFFCILIDNSLFQEIEVVESSWKDETRDLLESIKTLEQDNQRLTSLLTEQLQVN